MELTHAALGIHIDSDTAATRWRGERMDYDLGVWVLCNQAKRARAQADLDGEEPDPANLDGEQQDVSAGTSDA